MLDVMIYMTMSTATPNRLLLFTVLSDDTGDRFSCVFQIILSSFGACFCRLEYRNVMYMMNLQINECPVVFFYLNG